ncbi:MAG: hypothetical protein AAGN46_00860 [Acidobacteriota bacterium]
MRRSSLLYLVLVALLALVGCQATETETEDPSAAAWAAVEELRPKLDAKREELAGVLEEMKAAADGAAEAGDAAAEAGEEVRDLAAIEADVQRIEAEADNLSEQFYTRLVEYLNSADIVEGAELTSEQRQAFDYKAQEDMAIASEYIERGGDYQRAIDIYDQALMSDPTNQALLDAKAEAERLRFMTEDRFAQLEKKMSEETVRELLGPIKSTNVREYPERNRIGWFYRREDGGAAGVFFKETKTGNGEWVVETFDFDAVKPPTAEEEAAG